MVVSVNAKHLPRGVAAFLINAENDVAWFQEPARHEQIQLTSSASDPVRRREPMKEEGSLWLRSAGWASLAPD
jgi:hypothetical protein